METAVQNQENHQANFFLSAAESAGQEVVNHPEVHSDSNPCTDQEQILPGPAPAPGVDEVFLKMSREAAKLFDTISNHDQLTQQQRDKVRALIEKQRTALDIKISGQKPVEGEDFDSLAKLLRKENNKLDALLEGKDVLFTRFKNTANRAEESIAQMKKIIEKLEDES